MLISLLMDLWPGSGWWELYPAQQRGRQQGLKLQVTSSGIRLPVTDLSDGYERSVIE